ncbi:MAG: ABC transporter permease [Tissierellia bacterium]|nr:ABC transporter permease [Tissierellia bacterium]
MNSIDLIRMGIKNLWRRKLRTFLTVLGVIIGTSSIIVMLSLGFGMQEAFQNQLSRMGSLTIINVHRRYGGYDGMGSSSQEALLDDKALAKFKKIPHVRAVTPIVETYGVIINGRYTAHTSLKGIDPSVMEEFDFKIGEGRLLEPGDDFGVVFGGGMKYNFYDEQAMARGRYEEAKVDLMKDRMFFTFDTSQGMPTMPGENIERPRYTDYKIKTVGILEEGNYETDWGIYAPISTVERMIKEKERAEGNNRNQRASARQGYERVMVKVDDIDHVQDVQQRIKDEGYDAYSLNDYLDEMKRFSKIAQALLGGIGAVSLLVAAIGITNTMVMSIYERTKEIGIMKVIGASLRDIKRLFLFESAMIGLLGGSLGVIFSFGLSFAINKFGANFGGYIGFDGGVETKISIIPVWLIFAAMGFSALIGIISGYYPARRAMKLSALDAIRTE